MKRLAKLQKLCASSGIGILYVFGSRADEIYAALYGKGRIDRHAGSDVDLAVEMPGGQSLDVRAKAELAIAFEDLLGVGCVDLLVMRDADAFLAANVVRGNRLYCADALLADEHDLYVLRRAGDLAPFERQRLKMILESGADRRS